MKRNVHVNRHRMPSVFRRHNKGTPSCLEWNAKKYILTAIWKTKCFFVFFCRTMQNWERWFWHVNSSVQLQSILTAHLNFVPIYKYNLVSKKCPWENLIRLCNSRTDNRKWVEFPSVYIKYKVTCHWKPQINIWILKTLYPWDMY